jgi:hypothetical protein
MRLISDVCRHGRERGVGERVAWKLGIQSLIYVPCTSQREDISNIIRNPA